MKTANGKSALDDAAATKETYSSALDDITNNSTTDAALSHILDELKALELPEVLSLLKEEDVLDYIVESHMLRRVIETDQ